MMPCMTITKAKNEARLPESELDRETLELATKLIRAESISPEDAGCQQLIAEYLIDLGFEIEHLRFDDVDNLWAVRSGDSTPDGKANGAPLFVFAGHTDVVPTGPIEDWDNDPFCAQVFDGVLHGRGAADMKGSLASMLTATKRFLSETPNHKGNIGFLITSDEEDKAINGTKKVMALLNSRGTNIEWCLVGEPSSSSQLGDVVRTGRRGSLNAKLIVKGIQGHVAYPTKAKNPIHHSMAALADLVSARWDDGNEFFPPTTMQISNIHGGTGVNNVIPGEMVADFNFRFSTESTTKNLKSRTEKIIKQHGLDFEIEWSLSGNPFLTEGGELIPAVQESIRECCGIETELSTSGGTSDGRFIAPTGTQVIELGPKNATIHKINECVEVDDLYNLSRLYSNVLTRLLT